MKIFDTHAHYDDKAYDHDRHELIDTMLAAEMRGVSGFIAIGCNPKRNKKAIELAHRYEKVYATVGIHPGDIKNLRDNYKEELKALALDPKVVAIGETGLDYHYDGHDKNAQKKVFRESLELARSLSLPVIVHSRDAAADTMEILREFSGLPKVMHCYSGSVEMALELVKMGVFLSFTGVITFKNARKAAETAAEVPIEMLLLETDCPYMAPEPFRGKRCDSQMLWHTAAKLAEIKNMSVEEVVDICNNNAKRFFNIKF
ncbi:MAG: TatD family hydrolase [Oscillospiraceae bacterium]|nr:TatD family hydrolase [Oscillospiraceae bacterium]